MTMKTIILIAASLALASAAKFPTGLAPCPGYENHPFQFISGSIPEVFNFPGTASISYHAKRGIDLPSDLIMGFKIKKVAPYVYDVPCTFGQGSCEYPVCESKYFTQALCGQYPSWQQCGCPLRAGEVHLKNIQYPLPDLGVLGPVVKGDYEAKALFYSKANPDNVLGCVNMAFSVDHAKGHDEL